MKIAAFVLAVAATPLQERPTGAFQTVVSVENGDKLCTVLAKDAPMVALIEDLADKLELVVDGLRHIPFDQGVTVRLERRLHDQTLQYIVGGCGLRATTVGGKLVLRPELPPFPEQLDLLDQADLAHRRALKYAPESPFADRSEFALGRIAEERGAVESAIGQYDILLDQQPDSPLVPEALFRSAVLRIGLQRWEDAAIVLSQLIELEMPHEFAMDAHRLLALCTTHVGNHQRALYHLQALEKTHPAETGEERARRDFIRARAHIGLGDAGAALRLLERRESQLWPGTHPGERIELLADAMQVAGRPGDAAIAWLEYAKRVEGVEQARAFAKAARLALDGNDELGALLVAGVAEEAGHGEAVERARSEARLRLDLVEAQLVDSDADLRVARAEKLALSGMHDEVRSVLAPLATVRGHLNSALLMRFTTLYAQALAHRPGGIESAIAELRLSLPYFERIEDRTALYVLAGDLLEAEGLFDRSIDAYQGRL